MILYHGSNVICIRAKTDPAKFAFWTLVLDFTQQQIKHRQSALPIRYISGEKKAVEL